MNTSSWSGYYVDLSARPRPAASRSAALLATVERPLVGELASRFVRLGAQVIDACISLIPIGIAFVLTQSSGESPTTTTIRVCIWTVGILVYLIVQTALLTLRGQTLGKLLVGVRIVDYDDGSNPGFLRAVVLRNLVPGLISLLPCLGFLFSVVDVLSIFGEERRCLHDLFARTKVVDVA